MQACGLVGVGGAGFPTHVKLAANTIDTLLINAAECEPYLTTDCREMLECSDTIISGITAVMKYCEIPHCIIGIERNKPECIDLLTSLTREMKGVEVKGLPMRYPQGAEKTLVETCTGREVPQVGPSGKPGLPADVGCVIMNVTSVSTLGKFLKTGIPLVTKRVTVEGDAIAKPQNIEVPIGTLYRDVIDACGEEVLGDCDRWFASECYSAYLAKYPGALGLLGIRNEELGSGAAHHNGQFDLDESALTLGVCTELAFALD